MSQFTHPFDTIRLPDELWAYLQTLMPAGKEGNGFQYKQMSPAYALAIAQHYSGSEASTPECLVANVVATILSDEVLVVLKMLKSRPESALTANYLLATLEQGGQHMLAGMVTTLQMPLKRLQPGLVARQKVGTYLSLFTN